MPKGILKISCRLKCIPKLVIGLSLLLLFEGNVNNVLGNSKDNPVDQYLAFAEVMPEVKGGLSALYSKIQYPEIAKRAGISGKVYVMVFINQDGKVEDVQVIKGIGGGCDEAAVKAIKSAVFIPGSNQGVPVKVKMSLPINFQL